MGSRNKSPNHLFMTSVQVIMILVSVGVLAGLYFLLRKKRYILAILMVVAAAGAWFAYKEYSRSNADLAGVKPDYTLNAPELVKEFEINDSIANSKYLGRIIETTGIVIEINKDESGYYTVILGDTSSLSSVRCSMDTVHGEDAARLQKGSSAILRGACTGFNKDDMGLGSDVILNRCAIITHER